MERKKEVHFFVDFCLRFADFCEHVPAIGKFCGCFIVLDFEIL